MKYDVVVIGSGIGGLVCANLLAKEGLHVCVVEKNKQFGGNLQTFSRDKLVFDSGVHYIGGLEKGQNLYQLFKYLGIMDELKLERLGIDAFDKIIMSGDDNEYPQAQGYENFIQQLVKYFPGEEEGIRKYCSKLKDVCHRFPLYMLESSGFRDEKTEVMNESAREVIESFTHNKKLQAVLAGNNLLYAGVGNRTPFYILALTINSCIESSWRCVNGGSQIAKLLVKKLRENGGEIFRNAEVTRIVEENNKASFVEIKGGKKIYAGNFVSNIDPVKTLELTESSTIREAYRNRMKSIENTVSSFTVHIVLKEETVPHRNYNYYYHEDGTVWNAEEYNEDNWPLAYGLFFSPSQKHKGFAESITLLAVMRYDEVKKWEHTFNTTSDENDRGEEYNEFKTRKAERIIDVAGKKFPWLREAIKTYYTSTPLTFRDYIGSKDGSLYGFARDYKNPLKTMVSPKTRLPNLYLTGQSLNVHGILGTSISSILTCMLLLNNDKIVEKIKNA